MNGPKFQVGQAVAVCTFSLYAVIPATVVEDVEFVPRGALVMLRDGRNVRSASSFYGYRVAGHPSWIPEEFLRPINPGEYEESKEQTQKGIPA